MGQVDRFGLFLGIVGLIGVEINHLKWIWWRHWDCKTHGVKNYECRCRAHWMYLL
jgi:hypothetical protein